MLLTLIQKTVIEEKIQNAPTVAYQIGIIIGSYLPFAVLIGLAYWMYSNAKKRDKDKF